MPIDSMPPHFEGSFRSLDKIAEEYERTEITSVLLYERQEDRYINLFSVAEMCPVEQKQSPPFVSKDVNGTEYPQIMMSIGRNRKVFILRRFYDDPTEAIRFYRGQNGYRVLHDTPDDVHVWEANRLAQEPPNEIPLVLPVSTNSGMSAVLPRRLSSLRVCAQLDVASATRRLLSNEEFEKITSFVRQQLGIDLYRYDEYLGATLLCFSNPILRQLKERLTADGQSLLLELYPRRGKHLDGLCVELTDERPTGNGFTIFYQCEKPKQLLRLPNSPHRLRTRLFHPMCDVLFDDAGYFLNQIHLNIGLIGPTRRMNITYPDGKKELHQISTVTYNSIHVSNPSDLTAEKLILRSERRRELDKLEDNRVFIYFPPDPSSKQKAKSIVRELLGKVYSQCFICDPYLSARDVIEFALFVPNARVEVRLIGSVWWLKRSSGGRTNGEELYEAIQSIKRQDPTVKIEFRALKGRNKSPLHDRFIVIDEQVYILGSSLNEFGSRATTLFRVPDPRPLVEQAKKWWFQDDEAVGLETWIARRGARGDNDG